MGADEIIIIIIIGSVFKLELDIHCGDISMGVCMHMHVCMYICNAAAKTIVAEGNPLVTSNSPESQCGQDKILSSISRCCKNRMVDLGLRAICVWAVGEVCERFLLLYIRGMYQSIMLATL